MTDLDNVYYICANCGLIYRSAMSLRSFWQAKTMSRSLKNCLPRKKKLSRKPLKSVLYLGVAY